MDNPDFDPQETADQMAEHFFGMSTDAESRKAAVWQFLVGTAECLFLIPLLFYWRFGEIGGFGWGVTTFFVVYCLVAAMGFYFRPRTEYHTPVGLRGDWLDKVGAFWLVSCAFGPLLGWIITSVWPLTADSWRWLYAGRVILAAGLPLITALPLTRYVRGKSAWIALPVLVVITLLPVSTAVNVGRDLWAGPVTRQVQPAADPELYLPYTEQTLGFID